MWVGRIREFILVAGLWLLPIAGVLWLSSIVVGWALRTWPVLAPFALGLAAAYAYERTGWLLAPVLAHAVYNGVVVLLAGG